MTKSLGCQQVLQRAAVVACIRAFFEQRSFLEVDTPVLLRTVAPERFISALKAEVHDAVGTSATHYLQTSPELGMKRLVAAGLDKIFQVAPVFRDADHALTHRVEFRLVEWYRAHAPWTSLMDDCEALCAQVASGLMEQGVACAAWERPFRRIKLEDAFVEHAGFGLLDKLAVEPLRAALRHHGIYHSDQDSWDDLFGRVFVGRVEPALLQQANKAPFFLTHFPKPLAALARLSQEDPREAERFELYGGGLELANGFGELTCAKEQRQRFEEENAARQQSGLEPYPLDESFLAALDHLPQTSGIALGLERLWMALMGSTDMADVALLEAL